MKLPIKIACAFDPVAKSWIASLTMHQSLEILDSVKNQEWLALGSSTCQFWWVSSVCWQDELTVTWGRAGTINVAGSGRVCVFMK